MRHTSYILIIIALLSTLHSAAQIQVTRGNCVEVGGARGVDHAYLFDDLNDIEITYTGAGAVTFRRMSDGVTVCSGINACSQFDDGETYAVTDGTNTTTFVVFDYAARMAQFAALDVDLAYDSQCDNTRLNVSGTLPSLTYNSTLGSQTLTHRFRLSWNTLEWQDGTQQWTLLPQTMELSANTFPYIITTIAAPLCDTYFTLTDLWADTLHIADSISTASQYTAVAVAAHITTVTVARTDSNEVNRPDSASLTGSGPLEVEFRANPTPAVQYYQWKVRKSTDILAQRADENHRYNFIESGGYVVSLTVSNAHSCDFVADSVVVTISESLIDVPNVFTPNGDGINDEFRVAFRSLKAFDCWVYNRWGRLVYHWSDPTKGWNGKINGRDAAPGTYFYIIKARGSEGQKYHLSGDINLIGR